MNTPLRVLIVEDSPDDALMILRELRRDGYDVTYEQVDTAEAMAVALDKQIWDIILSDHVMPQFNSLAALKLLQEKGLDLPFIIVSGMIGEETATEAMKAGAHDYIMKNNLRRLVPAIRRELGETRVRRAHKQAEEALRESEQKYRELADLLPQIVFELDDRGYFTYANHYGLESSGYTMQDLEKGINAIQVFVPEDRDRVKENMLKVLRGATSGPTEYMALRKDGSTFPVIVYSSPVVRENKIVGLRGIAVDITERKRMEEQLAESAERLRLVFESVADGIAVTDLNGVITQVNEKTLETFGFISSEEVLGKTAFEFIAPGDHEKAATNMLKTLEQGTIENIEYTFRKKDGSKFPGESGGSVLKDASGNPIGFVAVLRDITERKRMQEQLKESAERLHLMFESAADGIAVTDLTGIITRVNRKILEMFGFSSEEEVLGKNLFEFIAPYQHEKATMNMRRAMEQEKLEDIEYALFRKDGSGFFAEVNGSMLKDASGKPIGFIALIRDITERRRMQEQLQESEEKLRLIFNSASEGITTTDLKGTITETNEATLHMHGFDMKDEVIGRSAFDLIAEKDHARAMENLKQTLEKSFVKNLEYTLLTKNRQEFDGELSAALLTDASGKPLGFVAITRDITERKQAKEALEQSLNKLRRTIDGTIQAIALITEMRDPYTSGHQRRVAKLACAIAEEIGLSKEQIETIHVAGTLHDIGKVYLPAEILSKPGRLNDIEMELIKTHPQVSREILKTIEFPWAVCPIVLQHHERIDGSGYPSGLSGENITLEARILGVADVVEAMASHRPYRPALGIDKALEEISRNKGILYDAEVVDACLRLFNQKGFKFEE